MAKKSNAARTAVITTLIVGLIGLNVFLWFYSKSNEKAMEKQYTTELSAAESLRMDLDKQYQDALSNIELFEGENSKLDSLIQSKKSELDAQKAKIQKLLKSESLSKGELEKAQFMMNDMRSNSQAYIREISDLRLTVQQLKQEKEVLIQEKVVLSGDLSRERAEKVELKEVLETKIKKKEAKVTQVTEEKEVVEQQLEEITNRAIVLSSANMDVSTVRYRNSGKEVATDNHKKVEKVKVCYDILSNKVAEAGNKNILLRILHPDGYTLAVEELGSGKFITAESNEERQYTTDALIDYVGETERFCTYWSYNTEFAPGVYRVELYHLGYEIGQGAFELKKKIF